MNSSINGIIEEAGSIALLDMRNVVSRCDREVFFADLSQWNDPFCDACGSMQRILINPLAKLD
jgi:hypothetical protein